MARAAPPRLCRLPFPAPGAQTGEAPQLKAWPTHEACRAAKIPAQPAQRQVRVSSGACSAVAGQHDTFASSAKREAAACRAASEAAKSGSCCNTCGATASATHASTLPTHARACCTTSTRTSPCRDSSACSSAACLSCGGPAAVCAGAAPLLVVSTAPHDTWRTAQLAPLRAVAAPWWLKQHALRARRAHAALAGVCNNRSRYMPPHAPIRP